MNTPAQRHRDGLWRSYARQPVAMVGLVGLLLVIAAVLLGPAMSPYAPDFIDFDDPWSSSPGLQTAHWFGTDSLGRDLFARTLSGGRVSLVVGVMATLAASLIGVAYGATAGYLSGWVDRGMMRLVDVLYALPFLFLVILLMSLFGRSLWLMFAAIAVVSWLDMARIVRGEALSLRQREFVLAARLGGASGLRIVWRHLVPNLLPVVIVYATLTVPQVMLIESTLSFLGLGVQAPATSWGLLIDDGAREMERTPWPLLFPAGFLVMTLLCLQAVGEGLRRALERQR